jgi:hypothetical protein
MSRAARLEIHDPLPGDLASFNLYRPALGSPAGKAAIRAWRKCLARHDLPIPDRRSPWSPLGTRLRHTQDIAVQDVHCKQQTQLVPRLAQAEAKLQHHWIETHKAALASQRAQIERQAHAAAAVIRRLHAESGS